SEAPPPYPVGPGHASRCHFHADVPQIPPRAAAEAPPAVAERAVAATLLELDGLRKTYRTGRTEVAAVAGVDLAVGRGEVLGLVGESGSGKTSLARVVVGLTEPSAGALRLAGT